MVGFSLPLFFFPILLLAEQMVGVLFGGSTVGYHEGEVSYSDRASPRQAETDAVRQTAHQGKQVSYLVTVFTKPHAR